MMTSNNNTEIYIPQEVHEYTSEIIEDTRNYINNSNINSLINVIFDIVSKYDKIFKEIDCLISFVSMAQ